MDGKVHILVVEDDADVRDALVDVLEAEGFSVATAEDGQRALEILGAAPRKPALILLDLMMPNMNGLQFREEQLRNPEHARIPVVMLTASMAEKASSLGEVSVVRKPFLIEALLAAVERALASHNASASGGALSNAQTTRSRSG